MRSSTQIMIARANLAAAKGRTVLAWVRSMPRPFPVDRIEASDGLLLTLVMQRRELVIATDDLGAVEIREQN